MAGIGVLHPRDPLKSGSGAKSYLSTPFLSKWCRRKPSPQKNGNSRDGGAASLSSSNTKKEKAMAEASSAPKIAERYAGWSFFTSPPPSSLPLPAFLTKERVIYGGS